MICSNTHYCCDLQAIWFVLVHLMQRAPTNPGEVVPDDASGGLPVALRSRCRPLRKLTAKRVGEHMHLHPCQLATAIAPPSSGIDNAANPL